jgi:hypothetical protein
MEGESQYKIMKTVEDLKNVVFWDVSPCGSCRNRHFRGTFHFSPSQKTTFFIVTAVNTSNLLHSERRLLVTANVVPSSPILVTLMMEALRSSEKSVLTRATRRNIPEDAILHSHCRENLLTFIALTG